MKIRILRPSALLILALAVLPATIWGQMDVTGSTSANSRAVLSGEFPITDNYFQEGSASYSGSATNSLGNQRSVTGTTSFSSQFSSSLIFLAAGASGVQNSIQQEDEAYGRISASGNISVDVNTYISLSLSGTVQGNNSLNPALSILINRDGVYFNGISSAQSVDTSVDLMLEPGYFYSFHFHVEANKTFTQAGAGDYGMHVTGAHAIIGVIPEPSTCALLALGAVVVLWQIRRRIA